MGGVRHGQMADKYAARSPLRGKGGGKPDEITREHQTGAVAFALTAVFKDGRRRETFPWSMYGGHEWTDDGEEETISAVFGERGLAVRGFRLAALDRDMSLGRRASIREHTRAQVEAMLAADGEEPIIASIETSPPLGAMVMSLKGEPDDYRNARKAE